MKSIVEVEINKPQREVAALFADPANNPTWMQDLDHYEPITDHQGLPGSKYRLVPRKGKMIFVATVVERKADELKLDLEASNVHVSVSGKLRSLTSQKTWLTSEEIFTFKGLFNKIFGFFARNSIKKVHRMHMEEFKKFAERS